VARYEKTRLCRLVCVGWILNVMRVIRKCGGVKAVCPYPFHVQRSVEGSNVSNTFSTCAGARRISAVDDACSLM
jgi:hypothetical protein